MTSTSSHVYKYPETSIPRNERYNEGIARRHSFSGSESKTFCPMLGDGRTRRRSEGDVITTYPTTLESLEYRLGRSNKGYSLTGRRRLGYLLGRRYYGCPDFLFQTRHINDVTTESGHADNFGSFDRPFSANERAYDSGYSSDNVRMRSDYRSCQLGRYAVAVNNDVSATKGDNSPSYRALAVQEYAQSAGDIIVPYSHQKSANGRHFALRRSRYLVVRYKIHGQYHQQQPDDKYSHVQHVQHDQQSSGRRFVEANGGEEMNTREYVLPEYRVIPYVSQDREKSRPSENTGIHGTTSYFTTRENFDSQYHNRGKLPRHERDHVLYHGLGKTTDVFREVTPTPDIAHI